MGAEQAVDTICSTALQMRSPAGRRQSTNSRCRRMPRNSGSFGPSPICNANNGGEAIDCSDLLLRLLGVMVTRRSCVATRSAPAHLPLTTVRISAVKRSVVRIGAKEEARWRRDPTENRNTSSPTHTHTPSRYRLQSSVGCRKRPSNQRKRKRPVAPNSG